MTIILPVRNFFVLAGAAALFLLPGCTPDGTAEVEPETTGNFIPTQGRSYVYDVVSEDGSTGTATIKIASVFDSANVHVYTQRTTVEVDGESLSFDTKLFDENNKTYAQVAEPPQWKTIINQLDALPDVTVTKAEVRGFPFYFYMDNVLKTGSKYASTAASYGQHIEFVMNGEPCSITQELEHVPSTGIVEQIKAPAGTFTCLKFSIDRNQHIQPVTPEGTENSGGYERLTIWMAHGVGMVKQESSSSLATVMVLPNGQIKKIVTNSSAVTTLKKIH